MRRVLISVLTVALVLGAMGGAAAAASSQASRDSSHSRHFTLSGTPDAFQNFSTTHCCEANPGDYIVEHVNLTTSGGQAVGGSDETCMLMFGNQGQHALCQYAIALTGRGTIHASGLYLSLHPDGHGGFLPDPFDAAVTGGTGDFPGAGGVIHITELDHQHRIYAISLR